VDGIAGVMPFVPASGSVSGPVSGSVSGENGESLTVLGFTGEVDNHDQLRNELAGRGHRFRTRSDTEVVLAAFTEWGPGAAARLDGAFAIAVWEPRRRRLTLVRDRLGIKPLYYQHRARELRFASELNALLAAEDTHAVLDLGGLRELMLSSHPMISTPGRTPFAGITELLPGHLLTCSPDGMRLERYWSLRPREHSDALPATVDNVRSLLTEAVGRHPEAEVPWLDLGPRGGLGLGDSGTSRLLFRTVREQHAVALSGEGADEVFGGYRWFHAGPDFTRLLDPDLAAALDLPAHCQRLYKQAAAELDHPDSADAREREQRVNSYLNLTRFLPVQLARTSRLSMSAGLAVRVPFCDHRLVEYVFNVPWPMKTFGGREKSLLRAAAGGLVPEPVLARPKILYQVTRDPSYRAALATQVRSLLLDSGSPALALLDPAAVRSLLLTDTPGTSAGLEFVLDLDTWLRHYRPRLAC
jgi:asparagine synthetase B (glutamine-hydrolysing)